ncbi:hypothetical protein G7Y89_g10497 [Cudoniella acicularis]|uniref:Lysine-specific metallo-endopeptidase domain-containing protein n=1 Tax=Cudoniella acicularis TaxID=354080 RepID=A0A8H4RDQ6_9HELO|nr:hypothetical protein G7Y89_g10497 [Cudoniella acicularis]
MLRVSILLSALGLTAALPSVPTEFTINWKRQDTTPFNTTGSFNATTTFHIYYCNATQTSMIQQAHTDALALVKAAFSGDSELSVGDNPHQFIDFTTKAAIDYFGPSDYEPNSHARIFDTFYRASQTYPGWGLSDWWNSRYIEIYCNDFADDCTNKKTGALYAAYISQTDPNTKTPRTWPWINYCPGFFDLLPSHGNAVAAIQSDTTDRKKLNTKNMRSQATTALHEWLHINNNYSAMICDGGCDDTTQYIGGVATNTYKSGATKLLARRDPELAAKTNDNFAYFATARFMLKTFGTYPDYPLAWDINKTPAQNRADEKLQPGDPDSTPSSTSNDNSTILDDGESYPDNSTAPTLPSDAPLLDSSAYPDWYQPVLSASASATATATESLPPLSTPTPPVIPPAAQPDLSEVVCANTTSGPLLPLYDDCVQAFAPTFVVNGNWTSQPPVPAAGTSQYDDSVAGTCELAIQYTGDWGTGCNATRGDVWAHARVVFEACSDYAQGLVGGYVPFSVPGCPANISIVHTVEAIS